MSAHLSFRFDNQAVVVNTASARALLDGLATRFRAGQGFSVATINLDHLVKLRTGGAFLRAYCVHTFVVADCNPIVWLSKLAGKPVELVPGSEMVEPLAAVAAECDVELALVGATAETLAAAAEYLERQTPGLKVSVQIAPSGRFDAEGPEAGAIIQQLGQSNARLCFLALGAPRQEVFAARAQAALPHMGFASIGAGLDFLAGSQQRAPKWARAIAMEWAWRLLSNPKRLAKRYLECALILPGLLPEAIAQRRRAA
jgi:N-acetylglucosaminyldiphosphoundecaprenol N-acetyl-beta-D-mannosaminyltransferase